MTPSLRGQLVGSEVLLGLVALATAAALVTVTTWMGRESAQLWQAGESVRVAQELQVSLLLHGRERRLLQVTRGPEHALAMAEAESSARRLMAEAHQHVSGAEEAALLEQVRAGALRYFAAARSAEGGASAGPSGLDPLLALTDRLVKLNVEDAAHRRDEAARWDRRANALGGIAALLLLSAVSVVLYSAQRLVYRPVGLIRQALHGFKLGSVWKPAPEEGAVELRDISQAFNEMAQRVERQREAQLSFLAGVAHDLRNPLQALRLAASSNAQPPVTLERSQQRLELVARQVDRLERMVNDLLDTSRIEAGQLELHLGEHDLRELVRESIELHRAVSERHTFELDLPAEAAPVHCDATRISQVLNNLLSNAIKYSPQGGTIHVRLGSSPGAYRVSVQDPGVGIRPAERETIFEPFRRSSTTRGVIPGIGLGLAVSRKIMLAHGGTLQLASGGGQGSTFELTLPAR